MRRSSKQTNINQLDFTFEGGLNYSQSPANIANNEMARCYNMIYDAETDKLITRPGTTAITTTTAITGGIKIGTYYKATSTIGYHVAAGNGHLYYASGSGLGSWTEIGDLKDSSVVPSMVTFNSKLYIADGDTTLKSWDGTTYTTTITNSPSGNALAVNKQRLISNHVSEEDSVYFSSPNDASSTGWDTSGTAVGLKAGFGDLMYVNSLLPMQDDLIVSKYATHGKALYRINMASGETASWYCVPFSKNNAAANNRSMINQFNSGFFIDTNGFKSLAGTSQYGDLAVDNIGRKINSMFGSSSALNGVYYSPSYNAIWFMISDNVVVYTQRIINGAVIPAFTVLYFGQRITSMYEVDSVVYFTGSDGKLYKLDETLHEDSGSSYISRIRTKMTVFPNDAILRRLKYFVNPVSTFTGSIWLAKDDTDKTLITTFVNTDAAEQTYLHDQTGYLNASTGYLSLAANESYEETTRNRLRDYEFCLEFECTHGRFGLDWVKAEIATGIEGGE